MKKVSFSILLLATLITYTSNAQTKLKPWQEWSQKGAETIVNDSSWGKTQVSSTSGSASPSALIHAIKDSRRKDTSIRRCHDGFVEEQQMSRAQRWQAESWTDDLSLTARAAKLDSYLKSIK